MQRGSGSARYSVREFQQAAGEFGGQVVLCLASIHHPTSIQCRLSLCPLPLQVPNRNGHSTMDGTYIMWYHEGTSLARIK